ncbi:putative small secreted protein [Anaerohalosphaera lusitana]|uniref:Putative small secreted protein n=1 Tax=Anaerohalosphaera lusitana TaxID=1936003 RepID=A0A1U9NJ05_9BACT|nr:entericidin A/B family lipoprotein [Anaerohalosphaera lusitana]AQT67704.1 putative small secreted protein [Anaerohalosphaera lusitana]
MKKSVTILLAFLLALTALAPMGCETIQGAGEDIENAGEELDEEF